MIKRINKLLKLVGLNLVRAKRKAPKSEAQKVKEFVREFDGLGKVPLSDYMGDAEWQTTPSTGKTHYVGDSCPGGHRDPLTVSQCAALEQARLEQPTSDNKIGGPTS